MTKKKLDRTRYEVYLFYFLLLLPLWMFLAWYFWPKTRLQLAIIDKTVLTEESQENASLNWILRKEKYTKANNRLYGVSRDYFGFFPKPNQKYELRGLERFDQSQLKTLTSMSDVAYVTDTYGIYSNEWFLRINQSERSRILYGGLSAQDMDFLQLMKEQKKLIITEFNTFASPTKPAVAKRFEETFKIHWTGWVGRYFDSFDTLQNKELPRWLIHNYKKKHHNRWPFKNSG